MPSHRQRKDHAAFDIAASCLVTSRLASRHSVHPLPVLNPLPWVRSYAAKAILSIPSSSFTCSILLPATSNGVEQSSMEGGSLSNTHYC